LVLLAAFLLLQAAQVVFAGQATVQLKGSVGKGTSTELSADIDTFVHHVGVVTQQQRSQFEQQVLLNFERSSISSRSQIHQRRIRSSMCTSRWTGEAYQG
jgi:hypothetical protein